MQPISRLEQEARLDSAVSAGQRLARRSGRGMCGTRCTGVWLAHPVHPVPVQVSAGAWLCCSWLGWRRTGAMPAGPDRIEVGEIADPFGTKDMHDAERIGCYGPGHPRAPVGQGSDADGDEREELRKRQRATECGVLAQSAVRPCPVERICRPVPAQRGCSARRRSDCGETAAVGIARRRTRRLPCPQAGRDPSASADRPTGTCFGHRASGPLPHCGASSASCGISTRANPDAAG